MSSDKQKAIELIERLTLDRDVLIELDELVARTQNEHDGSLTANEWLELRDLRWSIFFGFTCKRKWLNREK